MQSLRVPSRTQSVKNTMTRIPCQFNSSRSQIKVLIDSGHHQSIYICQSQQNSISWKNEEILYILSWCSRFSSDLVCTNFRISNFSIGDVSESRRSTRQRSVPNDWTEKEESIPERSDLTITSVSETTKSEDVHEQTTLGRKSEDEVIESRWALIVSVLESCVDHFCSIVNKIPRNDTFTKISNT